MPKLKRFFLKNKLIIGYILFSLLPFLIFIILPDRNLAPKITKAGDNSGYEYQAVGKIYTALFNNKLSTKPTIEFSMNSSSASSLVMEYQDSGYTVHSLGNRKVGFVKEDTQINYTTTENGVKEELILNKKQKTNEFKFNFWIKDIDLKKNTNISYTPYFFDKKGDN
ncbi:hypothetical protein M0R04_00005, partial [Candidatus Dojkabacteria bacterium]|nr:hypothetical protein [Candidatus Dojkabacteria bacterium]